MPVRDVLIRLGLNAAPFVAGVKQAQVASAGLATGLTKTAASGSKSAALLGSSFGTVGLVAGYAGVKMISAAADFDQAMSNVKATGADAVRSIGALREEAIRAGAATKYSATEAAGGIEALAKAGISSRDILSGGLTGALNLAAAGNLDVAASAEAAASAMSQFGLNGKDVPHVADLLAAGAGKAQGEVSDMAMALNQSGLVANQFGLSIEETVGTLAQLAHAGLVGSDAGTSLKQALLQAGSGSDTARAAMEKYKISLYDANGEFVGMTRFVGSLRAGLDDLSSADRNQALKDIFGGDAIRVGAELFKGGAKESKKWIDGVNDAGFAADTAATKMDNLKGDIEKLGGAIDTAFIKGGGGTKGPLRTLVQGITDAVDGLGSKDSQFNALNWSDKDKAKERILKRLGVRDLSNSSSSASADRQIKLTADISDITQKGNVADKIIDNVLQDRPTQVKADSKPAVAEAKKADKAIDGVKQDSVPKIDADASAAINAANAAQAAINRVIGGLANIGGGRATGGAIVGPGTGTSDSIPAMLSNGEHVLTASDVNKVGGQAGAYRMRSAIQSGALKFASGGPVGLTSNQWALEIARLQAQMSDNRSQLKTAKGSAKRVLELEYIEDKAALRRLKGGLSSDFEYGLQSILDARNEPVSLFGGYSDSPWMQGGNFGSQATQKLTQIRTLAGKLAALRKMGLTGALIGEIASLGSGQGIAAADELLKSPSQIRQLNAAYAGIQGYQGLIAAAAYQAPYAGAVRISIENLSIDVKKSTASMRVVARDEAGKVIDQQSFNQAVHS